MPEDIKEEVVEEKHEEKKKGLLAKARAAILPDAEEQAAIISTMVRIGVLVWSGGILTLNYVAIPGVPQQKIDPTFIASVSLEFWPASEFKQHPRRVMEQ